MKRKKNRPSKRQLNKGNKLVISFFVIVFVCIMGAQIYDMKHQDEQLRAEEARLQAMLQEEEERTETLEQQALFVQTKEYVEQVARELGLVYPDEIILKPME